MASLAGNESWRSRDAGESGSASSFVRVMLRGLVNGRAVVEKQLRGTIGYRDLRHGAVGLEQFLPELFVGVWVGDDREEALRFAHGEGGPIVLQLPTGADSTDRTNARRGDDR